MQAGQQKDTESESQRKRKNFEENKDIVTLIFQTMTPELNLKIGERGFFSFSHFS